MNSKEMIELFESAQKIYKSAELKTDEKYEILFSDRFYKKINFEYKPFDGEYYEWVAFCAENMFDDDVKKENTMKMMMKEFENLVQKEYKIERIINS